MICDQDLILNQAGLPISASPLFLRFAGLLWNPRRRRGGFQNAVPERPTSLRQNFVDYATFAVDLGQSLLQTLKVKRQLIVLQPQ